MDETTVNVIKLGFITFEGTPQDFLSAIICVTVVTVVFFVAVKLLIEFISAVWRIAFVYGAVPFTIYQLGIRAVTEEYAYLPILLCVVYVIVVLLADPFDRSGRKRERRARYDEEPEPPPERRHHRRRTQTA